MRSDDEIIGLVQRGDSDAYVELFDRYYARIYRYALSQLRSIDAARDAAADTFARGFKAIASFRLGTTSSYFPYLLQICRRLIYAERMRARRGFAYSLDDPESGAKRLVDSCGTPEEHLIDEERKAMIRQSLDSLSPEDREIILLAFERDLSRRDIATLIGKPSQTAVTSHLHRAMKKLKQIVAGQGYFGQTNVIKRN